MSNGKVVELAYSNEESGNYLVQPELNYCLTCGKQFSANDIIEGLFVGEYVNLWLQTVY